MKDGARVLSLEALGGQWMLVDRTLRVREVEDPFLDADGGTSGKEVSADGTDGDALAYLSGLPLHSGAVAHVFDGAAQLVPGMEMVLPFNGTQWTLKVKGRVDPEDGYPIVRDYELVLSDGHTEQRLVAHGELDDAFPVLQFAGDLDGDGRLDLLVDTTRHYNVSSPTLFLSSQAPHRNLVQRAATFESVGC